jgi:hypothetical protein
MRLVAPSESGEVVVDEDADAAVVGESAGRGVGVEDGLAASAIWNGCVTGELTVCCELDGGSVFTGSSISSVRHTLGHDARNVQQPRAGLEGRRASAEEIGSRASERAQPVRAGGQRR